jgi:hypothetical protein
MEFCNGSSCKSCYRRLTLNAQLLSAAAVQAFWTRHPIAESSSGIKGCENPVRVLVPLLEFNRFLMMTNIGKPYFGHHWVAGSRLKA